MKKSVNQKGWVFQFNRITMFVTTFAPFYPEDHSRFSFGSNHCYVLFQPEVSFSQYDLTPDTPHTNWINPKTTRDRTRCAYKHAGRGYRIRDTVHYPTAWEVVKSPMDCHGQPDELIVEWWNKGSWNRMRRKTIPCEILIIEFIHCHLLICLSVISIIIILMSSNWNCILIPLLKMFCNLHLHACNYWQYLTTNLV